MNGFASALILGGGMFFAPRFAIGERHVHGCPECHDDEVCEMACSHFDSPVIDGELKRGGYVACASCSRRLEMKVGV